jgi:iron complex outermembrane receptor protein
MSRPALRSISQPSSRKAALAKSGEVFRKRSVSYLLMLAFGSGGTLLSPMAFADDAEVEVTEAAEVTDSAEATDAGTADATTAAGATGDAGVADSTSLATVKVTAQKREESVQKVATPITVLNGDALLDAGIGRSANEVLNSVPNASAATQAHGRPRWWIRGAGTGQQQLDFPNPIGFYLDDVYISNASATGFPLFDLERVEVLRGPQGTLWGKNTTGGAINVISRKPTFAPESFVKLDYGTYNDRIFQAAVSGPLVDNVLAGRLSVYTEDQDGRFKNSFEHNKKDDLKERAIRGQLLGLFSPEFEAALNVHYRDYKTTGGLTTVSSDSPTGEYRNGYFPSRNRDVIGANAPQWSDITQLGGNLNLKWELGKLSLTSITAYEDFKNKSQGDGDNTPLEISRSYGDVKSRQISQEFRLASPREDRWNWLVGAHYFYEKIDSYSAGAALPNARQLLPGNSAAAANYSSTTFDHETTSYAIFGSTTFNFTDKFDTTLGLRWTTEEKKLDLTRRASSPANPPVFLDESHWWRSPLGTAFTYDPSKRWNAFTYDITPQYKVTDNLRVYLRYAKGVKSGGFNTSATNVSALATLDPEVLNSVELGLKSEWLNGKLNFNANIFGYKYKDVQVNVVGPLPPTNVAVSYMQNVSKGRAYGAEFEIEALPIDNLHVSANLGLLKTEFTDFEVLNGGGDYSGNEFVRSPHVNAQLAADYKIPVGNGNKIVLGGDVRYIGKQYYYTTNQNNPLLGEDAYAITNARISYVTLHDALTLTAYINNIGDTKYRNHALPSAQGATGAVTYWGARRTGGVSLTYHF